MKRICIFLISLSLVLSLAPVCHADENTLVIAILSEADAMNLSTEEAFFAMHPEAAIEYRIISQDQLSAALLSGAYDFDLTILPYQNALNMAKKGYFTSVSEQLGIVGYPDSLLDVSALLTWEGDVFGLPLSIYEAFYLWDDDVAEEIGIKYPDVSAWSWEDFYTLQERFPIDLNNDGAMDAFIMEGSMLAAYPAFLNCNMDMFKHYVSLYDDFSYFSEHLLPLFRKIVVSDATLSQTEDHEGKSVLIYACGMTNPIDLMDEEGAQTDTFQIMFEKSQRFLPMPLLNAEEEKYYGNMDVLSMMKNAPHPELARDFLRAYVSDTALDYVTSLSLEKLVSKKLPSYWYRSEDERCQPVFTIDNDVKHCIVTSGRDLPVLHFMHSEEAFYQSQAYREKLSCDTFLLGRDFYDAAWAYLQDWYLGRIDDRALTDEMSYLFDLARGQR